MAEAERRWRATELAAPGLRETASYLFANLTTTADFAAFIGHSAVVILPLYEDASEKPILIDTEDMGTVFQLRYCRFRSFRGPLLVLAGPYGVQ
eukprot:2224225-Prorocentrum_lima.AAC.1